MFKLSPHIAVQVKKMKEAATFYKEVMGFEFNEIRPFESGEEAVMEKDGTNFYFEAIEEHQEGRVFFEFETEDIQQAEEKLIAAGCEIYQAFSPVSKMVRDPYGMRFHLFQKIP